MASHDYHVRVSAVLQPTLHAWRLIEAEKPRCAEAIVLKVLRSMVDNVISDPEHNADSRTHLRAELHPVRRLKGGPKSRYRVFYIVSDEKKTAILLWLGYRREGDTTDAYAEFEQRLAAGDFDPQFEELGIPLPKAAGTRS